jgi:hypothetical protein
MGFTGALRLKVVDPHPERLCSDLFLLVDIIPVVLNGLSSKANYRPRDSGLLEHAVWTSPLLSA